MHINKPCFFIEMNVFQWTVLNCHQCSFYISQSTGEVQEFSYWSCDGDASLVVNEFFTVTYKFCLHAAAIILSFLTRNVKITGLNDYKYNVLIVYLSSAVLLVWGVTMAFLREFVNTYAFLVPTSLFCVSTVFLVLTFVPKVWGPCSSCNICTQHKLSWFTIYNFIMHVSIVDVLIQKLCYIISRECSVCVGIMKMFI